MSIDILTALCRVIIKALHLQPVVYPSRNLIMCVYTGSSNTLNTRENLNYFASVLPTKLRSIGFFTIVSPLSLLNFIARPYLRCGHQQLSPTACCIRRTSVTVTRRIRLSNALARIPQWISDKNGMDGAAGRIELVL